MAKMPPTAGTGKPAQSFKKPPTSGVAPAAKPNTGGRVPVKSPVHTAVQSAYSRLGDYDDEPGHTVKPGGKL